MVTRDTIFKMMIDHQCPFCDTIGKTKHSLSERLTINEYTLNGIYTRWLNIC